MFLKISLQRWRRPSSRGSACLCLWDPRHSPLPVPHPSRPKHGTNKYRLVQVTKWQKGLWQKKIMVKFAGSSCIHHRPGFSCLHAHPPLHRFNKWDQNDHANVIIQSVFHSTLEIFSQCAFLTSFSRSKGGAFPDRLLLFCQLVDNPAGERDLPSKCQQSNGSLFFFHGGLIFRFAS